MAEQNMAPICLTELGTAQLKLFHFNEIVNYSGGMGAGTLVKQLKFGFLPKLGKGGGGKKT